MIHKIESSILSRRELANKTQAPHKYKKEQKDAYITSPDARAFAQTYRKAGEWIKQSGITAEDVAGLTDKFWAFYMDGSCVTEPAATILVSIHWNLCMGTIAPHRENQPHLQLLLEELEDFRVCGQFMLTEVGHGLDARNIETTATLSPDGTSFDLHSPSPTAAKSMPPTTPLGGVPKVAVVFAQLMINNESQGARAFIVHLTDGEKMCQGVDATLLPQRPGSQPIDHAVTTFTHVTLDRNCLLGPICGPGDRRQSLIEQIHRVSVGGLSLSLCNIPALKASAYLATAFSNQRKVVSPVTKQRIPIISFPTQYGPIISTVALAAVMDTAGRTSVATFQVRGIPEPLRHALVCIFKATATYASQRHMTELTDRCGWRGLYAFNKISEMQLALKGNSIAEGDVMVLCIRLASELIQGKYDLPSSSNPDSLLARREQGLFEELRNFLINESNETTSHRSDLFAQNVTPRATELVIAIGHRFAYDSAVDTGIVRQELIDVWEADCILRDAAWYVEHAGLTGREIQQKRTSAVERVRPYFQTIVDEFDMEKHFCSTPLVSEQHWDDLLGKLPTFTYGTQLDGW